MDSNTSTVPKEQHERGLLLYANTRLRFDLMAGICEDIISSIYPSSSKNHKLIPTELLEKLGEKLKDYRKAREEKSI